MRIACIGWGSLIWDRQELPLSSDWFTDGPVLPIEFARESSDKRITLVITPGSMPIQCLWVRQPFESLKEAIPPLTKREKTTRNRIGSLDRNSKPQNEIEKAIHLWLLEREIDGVVWTNLGPKMGEIDRTPNVDEVIMHLSSLNPETEAGRLAREYVCRAPKQVNTEYRRSIEEKLGWTCISNI